MNQDHTGVRAGRISRLLGGAVVALVAAALLAPVATAHENRTVGNGNYSITVGFLNEPAYVGLENGLYFEVVQIGGANQPVADLQNTLQAEVTFGADTKALTLTPIADRPGQYSGVFVPTQVGDYSFSIFGKIGDQDVDETFRSSPNTFDSVQPATAIQFPEAAPAGADLADEIDSAKNRADTARNFAFLGIAVGVVGVVLGAAGFAFGGRRKDQTAD